MMKRISSEEGLQADEVDALESEDNLFPRSVDSKTHRLNGYLELEAEESDNEASDINANLRQSLPNGFTGNGHGYEDSEEAENLDEYESDFIDDDAEAERENDDNDRDDEH